MPVELDDHEVRPLNSRQVNRILCSVIAGVVAADPNIKIRVPQVIQLLKRPAIGAHALARQDEARRSCTPACDVSWEIALLATISGLRTWCEPDAVDHALAWIDLNLDTVYASASKSQN